MLNAYHIEIADFNPVEAFFESGRSTARRTVGNPVCQKTLPSQAGIDREEKTMREQQLCLELRTSAGQVLNAIHEITLSSIKF